MKIVILNFWKRQDVIPGFDYWKEVIIDDKYLNRCFYDRSIYLESTKQILHGTPFSMISHPLCWILSSHINPFKKPEDYPELWCQYQTNIQYFKNKVE